MPVDKNFLKNTLERSLAQTIEIQRLFDFLKDIIDTTTSSQKQSLDDFIQKWTLCFNSASRKMMILRYEGTWAPASLTPRGLQKQKDWKEFVGKYDSKFTDCTINSQDSPEYQPTNFTELVRQTFWRELYERFGHRIVAYIFEKCALMYEVDEGLYLVVGCPTCVIYKKLTRFYGRDFNNGGFKSVTQPSSYNNPYQVQVLEECDANGTGRQKNEGGLACDKENSNDIINPHDDKSIQIQRNGGEKRARTEDFSEEKQEIKRRKIETVADDNGKNITSNDNSSKDRWILPKPEVLRKVIQHFERLRKHKNIPRTSTSSSLINCLSFVRIQKDATFEITIKGTNKVLVLKQKGVIPISLPEVPKHWGWEGLKLPKNLGSMADNKGNIELYVYTISETLAKQLDIRIKPKGRQKKKPALMTSFKSMAYPTTLNTDEHLDTNTGLHKISQNESGKISASALSERKQPILQNTSCTSSNNNINKEKEITSQKACQDGDQRPPMSTSNKIQPYFPSYTLPVSPCLYNNSSWSKWPAPNSLSRAASLLKQQDEIGSIRALVDSILKVETCSYVSFEYLLNTIKQNWNLSEPTHPLNKTFIDIIQSHSKFTDIHKLFKNCATYWFTKYSQKLERKRKSKMKSETSEDKIDSQIVSKNFKGSKKMESIDCVDLCGKVSILKSNTSTCGKTCKKPFVMKSSRTLNITSGKQSSSVASLRNGKTAKKISFKSLKHPIPHNCIMQSLKQIFHIMKIDRIFGSKRNVRGFFKFVRKALILGGTKSSLHLSELMAMIHQEDMGLYLATKCKVAVEIFTGKLMAWLFNDYVLVLLSTCCYITECNFSRMQLTFYLRESWISASCRMKTHLIEQNALEDLTQTQTSQKTNAPINANLRFVPKRNCSLRSLLIMKKSVRSLSKDESKKLNVYLHYVDAKVNKSRMYLPTTLQYEWRKFISEWKKMDSPKLFYTRLDIQDAFPSVKLNTLKRMLADASGGRKNTLIIKKYAVLGSNGIKRVRESIFDSQCRGNMFSGIHIRPCIAVDLGNDTPVNVWQMLEYVGKAMNELKVVAVGKKTYQFHYGLPQGGVHSPILCSIYYGCIDSKFYLPHFEESEGRLFLRIVDDYLFVTPDPNEILNLMELMKMGGYKKYGIKINKDKSINNVFVRSNEPAPSSYCEQVTFCGWNFCMTCGHVSRDFKKYIGQDFCSTISFQLPNNITTPEQFLRLRGTLIVPARVRPILLDPSINCYKRILLTVFEASIILSFRFYAICRVIYPNLEGLKEEKRAKEIVSFIFLCVTRLAKYAARNAEYHGPTFSSQEMVLCQSNCCGGQNTSLVSNSSNNSVKELLSVESLKFISLFGFRLKLQKHSSVFEKIIPRISAAIVRIRSNIGDIKCENMLGVVGTNMPSYFNDILI